FELGARWGAGLHLAPLLARGADSKFLRGPLGKLNALQANEEPQMHQLIQDIARKLNRTPKNAAVYGKALQKLIGAARIKSLPDHLSGNVLELASSIPANIRDDLLRLVAKHDRLSVEAYARTAGISKARAEHFGSELVNSGLLDYGIDDIE